MQILIGIGIGIIISFIAVVWMVYAPGERYKILRPRFQRLYLRWRQRRYPF